MCLVVYLFVVNESIFYFFYNLAHQSVFFDKIVIFLGTVFPILALLGAGFFLFWQSDVVQSRDITKDNLNKLIKNILIIFGPALITFFIATFLKDLIQIDRSFIKSDTVAPLFN